MNDNPLVIEDNGDLPPFDVAMLAAMAELVVGFRQEIGEPTWFAVVVGDDAEMTYASTKDDHDTVIKIYRLVERIHVDRPGSLFRRPGLHESEVERN